MTEQKCFETPAQNVIDEHSTKKEVEVAKGFVLPASVCNFCDKHVKIDYTSPYGGWRTDYDFDTLLENICCDRMRAEVANIRKKHEKSVVEYFISVTDASTPPIYRKFRLTHFDKNKNILLVRKYFKEKTYLSGKGFYIYSKKNGTGKTALSCTIAKTLCGVMARTQYSFLNYPDFVNSYEQADFNDKYDILENYKESKVLVIDDLGKGRSTNQSITNIYDIVNFRNINQMITIVNSNISLHEISEKFDSSVSSRLYEMCDIIEMEGEDLRIATAKQEVTE